MPLIGDRARAARKQAAPLRQNGGRQPSFSGASPQGELGSAEVLGALLDSAPDAIVAVGQEGRIVLVNAQTEELFGYPRAELIGEPVEKLIPDRFHAAHIGHRSGYFSDPHTRPMGAGLDLYCRRRDGSEFPAEISLSCIDSDGGPIASAAIRDVSERKRLEHELRHLAEHDSLTGLLNRRRFEAELERQVALTRRYGDPSALLSLDLDGFKAVNDTYGHAVGDELLRRTASALRSRLRTTDLAARMGGDEFAVLLPAVGSEEASIVARDLLRLVSELSAELGDLPTSASIGIALLDHPDTTPEELSRRADVAMYAAKEAGGNRLVVDAAAPPAGGPVRHAGRPGTTRR